MSRFLTTALSTAVLLIATTSIQPAIGQINATWIGGDGLWNQGANWSTDPTVPNGDPFNLFVDGGNATASTVRTGSSQTLAAGNITIDVGDSLIIENASDVTIGTDSDSVLMNRGNINFRSDFQTTEYLFSRLRIRNQVTLDGSGVVNMEYQENDYTAPVIQSSESAVGHLINVNNVIQGTGFISGVQLSNLSDGIIDAVPLSTGAPFGVIQIEGRTTSGESLEMVNHGIIRASSEGELRFYSGNWDNTGGLIEGSIGSSINLDGNISIRGGTIRSADDCHFEIDQYSSDPNGGPAKFADLTIEGTVTVAKGASLILEGAINNTGTIKIDRYADSILVESQVTLTGGGTIDLRTQISNYIIRANPNAAMEPELINVDNTIRAGGSLDVKVANRTAGTIIADDPVFDALWLVRGLSGDVNDGRLIATNGGRLAIGASPVANQKLFNNGLIQSDADSLIFVAMLTNNVTGMLAGNGVIDSGNAIINHGRIAPGSSVGHLTLDAASVTFGDTSVLEIEIDASGADLLTVLGDLMLEGEVQISLLDGFVPLDSTTYQIAGVLDDNPNDSIARSLTGAFAGIDNGMSVLTDDGRGSFVVTYTNSGVFLSNFVAIVPEPNSATLLLAFSVLSLNSRRRRSKLSR